VVVVGRVRAIDLVVLDVNETLLSLDPVAERLADIGLEGQLDMWFAAVLRDGFAAALAGRHVTLVELARDHVATLLVGRGLDAAEAHIDHVLGGFAQVHAHDDVADGLRLVADAGVPAVTLTNGSVGITRDALERAGLRPLVAAMHDVEGIGRWKPAPETYLAIVAEHGTVPERTAFVAVHPWDVQGAQAARLVGAWLDRDGRPYPRSFPAPDVTATSLPGLVERLVRA
jgi:2-haloacid dehalogenase